MWKRELTSKPVKTREKRSLNTSLNICACVWVRIGSEGGKGIEIEGERERWTKNDRESDSVKMEPGTTM